MHPSASLCTTVHPSALLCTPVRPRPCQVCIRGSKTLTDAVIHNEYKCFGPDGVLSILWQYDSTNGSFLGHGFVCFKTADMASQALTWGEFMLDGKWVGVFRTGKKFSVVEKGWTTSDGWRTARWQDTTSAYCAPLEPCTSPALDRQPSGFPQVH